MSIVSFWSTENALEADSVTVVQLGEYTKYTELHTKRVNFMVCVLHLRKMGSLYIRCVCYLKYSTHFI